jgi:hypothetical protein
VTSKHSRDLERDYCRERTAILEDDSLSWEKKMFAIKDLHAEYSERMDAAPFFGADLTRGNEHTEASERS